LLDSPTSPELARKSLSTCSLSDPVSFMAGCPYAFRRGFALLPESLY
jgi:hypothetical protein